MADNGNVKNGIAASKRVMALVAISSVLGATGGPLLLVKFGGPSVLRPDPFTGSEAKILERRLDHFEWHVRNHPDATGKFETRIATLEAQNQIIILNQSRIMDRLDKINR